MARYMRTSTVISRQIAGELVLVPIIGADASSGQRTANFYVLNGSAEVLWNRLASPADESELTAHLVALFDVDEETARRDVAKFLEDLGEAGAITPFMGEGAG